MKRTLSSALLLVAVAGCSAAPTGSPAAGSSTAGPGGGRTRNVGITRLDGVDPADRATAEIDIAFDEAATDGLLTIPAASSAP